MRQNNKKDMEFARRLKGFDAVWQRVTGAEEKKEQPVKKPQQRKNGQNRPGGRNRPGRR